MDAFKKKSKSGFPPYFENTMEDIVSGDPADSPAGAGVSLKHQWMRGPQDYFPADAVADLNPSQLADLSRIRQFGVGQTRAGSTLGQAASQLGTLYDASGQLAQSATSNAEADRAIARARADTAAGRAGTAAGRGAEVGAYGTGIMNYGTGATQTGLSQQQYAGYTPFQGQQLESMLAGEVDTSGLQDVYDVMAKQASQAMSPQLAALRRQIPISGAAGTDTRTAIGFKEAMESGLHEKLADAWAPMAYKAKEQAEDRRLKAGKLALDAQIKAQELGTKGAELGLGAGRLDVSAGGLDVNAGNLNVAGGQLVQQGISNATNARMLGLNAAQLAPQITAAQMGGLQSALQTGNIRQAQQQSEIDADINKWNYNQNKDMLFARNMIDMMGSARVPTIQTATPSLGSTLMNLRPLGGLFNNQATTPDAAAWNDPDLAMRMQQQQMDQLYADNQNYRNMSNPGTWRTT